MESIYTIHYTCALHVITESHAPSKPLAINFNIIILNKYLFINKGKKDYYVANYEGMLPCLPILQLETTFPGIKYWWKLEAAKMVMYCAMQQLFMKEIMY